MCGLVRDQAFMMPRAREAEIRGGVLAPAIQHISNLSS